MIKIELQKGYKLFVAKEIETSVKDIKFLYNQKLTNRVKYDILCPVFLDRKKRIFYHGGGITPHEMVPYPIADGEMWINQYPEDRKVEFSPLWCFAISERAYKQLKLYDFYGDNIFEHLDTIIEADKKGLNVGVTPDIAVTYGRNTETNKKRKNLYRELLKAKEKVSKKHGAYIRNKYKLPVVMHTHTGYAGGYNMHARELVHAMLEKKIKVHYKFIGGSNLDEPQSKDYLVNDARNDMGSLKLPQIVLSTGLNCFSNSGKYKIGFTTTEVDGIPKDWVKILNEMDEVWTTSEFAKRSFKASGVTKPIYNMGEGVNVNYFHPKVAKMDLGNKDRFLFISNFAWGMRKGVDIIFEAFQKEFDESENVAFFIKALPSYWGADINEDMKRLYKREKAAPIIVAEAFMDPYLIGSFYQAGNCLVFPSRGEGYGLPLIEALATGIPVITTGATGQLDFLTKSGDPLPGVELIKAKKVPFDGTDSYFYKGFNWYEPSVSDLRKKMRQVFTNYEKYKADALKTSEYIRAHYSWDLAADLVINRLRSISNKMLYE